MTQNFSRILRQDLLQVADTVAREKNIERENVFEVIEAALQKAAQLKYGNDVHLRVMISRHTGAISLYRILTVVDVVEEPDQEISKEDGEKIKPGVKVGDEIVEELPSFDFGRVSAQVAKQVVVQRVRDIEREKQYLEFKDRVGEVVSGVIRRAEYGNLYVDLGKGEAFLRRDDLIPREILRVGDRVKAYISDVKQEGKGPQVFLSRTHPKFMAKLFTREVPEIYDNIIEIKAVSRDPGSRAKIAVYTRDPSIDPVGACVGLRGSRVQAVVSELQGEKVDIIPWSPDPATFVVNALAPAEVAKVVLDEEAQRIEVVVPDEHLSLAIGRRGQNVRLASQLTGWTIDILTEKEESEKRIEEVKTRSQIFIQSLNVDEMVAHLLVGEGFSSVEEVAYVSLEDLQSVEGFDEDLARELQTRARNFLAEKEESLQLQYRELGVDEGLVALEGITSSLLVRLGTHNVKTLADLAELSTDEAMDVFKPEVPSVERVSAWIMQARSQWFSDPVA